MKKYFRILLLIIVNCTVLQTLAQEHTNSATIERTDNSSSVLNLKNTEGFWHLSGPRSYEANNPFSIFWNDGTYKRYFTINDIGNVGIGEMNPQIKLHIKTANTNSEILRLDGGTRTTSLIDYSDGTYDNAGLQFKKNSIVGQFKFSNNNGDLMTILSGGNVGIGTTSPGYALDVTRANHNVARFISTGTNSGPDVLIVDKDNLSSRASLQIQGNGGTIESLFVSAGGNVGIGTTSPSAKLDIEGGNLFIGEESSTNGTRRYMRIFGYDNNAKFYGTLHSNYDDSRRTFDICTNDAVQQIKIDASASSGANIVLNPGVSGNVGIGTTSPDMKLTVAGHVNVGGTENGTIKVRHVTGKSHNSTGYGNLYLNYHTSLPVIVGTTTNPAPLYTYGNVAIGTTTPATGYKLSVAGKIMSEGVKVQLKGSWPDYVFSKNYKLKSLSETESYIKENQHLPEMPSADEVAENGIELGEMNAKLLQKIEELTLHLISQQKRIEELERKVGE